MDDGADNGHHFRRGIPVGDQRRRRDLGGSFLQRHCVTHTGEDTVIGSQNTAEGDAPVVTGGNKHGPAQIEVRFVYTKETSKLWDVLRDAWEGTKRLYLRWAPEGGIGTVVGNEQFMAASDAGTAFPCRFAGAPLVPNVDVGAGGPAVSMARFTCPKVVRSLTTTS